MDHSSLFFDLPDRRPSAAVACWATLQCFDICLPHP